MKKLLHLSAVMLISFLVCSCSNQPAQTSTGISKEDSAILIAWKQMYKDKTPEEVYNKKILVRIPNHKWVDSCIDRFKNVYGKTSDGNIKKAHTEEVVFNKKELQNWLNYLDSATICDNINIQFGVYPEVINATDLSGIDVSKIKPNRMTVFLWPYNGKKRATLIAKAKAPGDEADPYNLGEIHPPY